MNSTDYLLAFSSFYKAAYAQEILMKQRFTASLRKLPPGLLQSCGYGLTLRTKDGDSLRKAVDLLERSQIRTKGVYSVRREENRVVYDKVYL
ncbi:MAG: DUF3343 domain-containing protein [Firmicutes bacterium]|nr:DUF3343 domain-containing protein [Bacillota bacterium]